MESRSRQFPQGLATFIALATTPAARRTATHRSGTPITPPPRPRWADHRGQRAGTCEACNYAKEAPGWRVLTWRNDDGTHVAEFTTPTGACHQSKAPPLLGGAAPVKGSGIEVRIANHLAHAA